MLSSAASPVSTLDGEDHPHALRAALPVRLPGDQLKRLSALEPWRALLAIGAEWGLIAASITLALWADRWFITLLALIVIGARQHALTVIAHDAAHYRLLPGHALNDWAGNLLLAWPMFISVQGFRHYHADHHRYLNREGDGNRALWSTHDGAGELRPAWRYPKSKAALALELTRRVVMLTGVFWLIRGLVGGFMFGVPWPMRVVRVALLAALASVLTTLDAWPAFALFWALPYCTMHVLAQYVRLICEHSAVSAADARFSDTRSTLPGLFGRAFVLPRNIGYHIEHHLFPSVPFYNLPALQAALLAHPDFAAHARINRSLLGSLSEVTAQAVTSDSSAVTHPITP